MISRTEQYKYLSFCLTITPWLSVLYYIIYEYLLYRYEINSNYADTC